MIDLSLALAFIVFVAFISRIALNQVKSMVKGYQHMVQNPFDQGEANLNHAKEKMQAVEKETLDLDTSCANIMNFAREEAERILKENQHHLTHVMQKYENLLSNEAKNMRSQWNAHMIDTIWEAVLKELYIRCETFSAADQVRFVAHSLEKMSTPRPR